MNTQVFQPQRIRRVRGARFGYGSQGDAYGGFRSIVSAENSGRYRIAGPNCFTAVHNALSAGGVK